MTRRVKVPIHQSVGKFATVEDGATNGATLGVNLFNPDGTIVSTLNAAPSSSPSSSGGGSGVAQSGVITPTELDADTDDWAPDGLSTAAAIRASTDASRTLSGLTGGSASRQLFLFNVGANDLVLAHDATSTAANRFLCPGSANLTLHPNDSVRLWYDGTSSRWRAIGV